MLFSTMESDFLQAIMNLDKIQLLCFMNFFLENCSLFKLNHIPNNRVLEVESVAVRETIIYTPITVLCFVKKIHTTTLGSSTRFISVC